MGRSGEDGTIPDGWQMVRLGDVAAMDQGGTPPKNNSEYWDGHIPFITGADLTEFRIGQRNARAFLTTGGLYSGSTVACEVGTLLLATRTRVGLAGMAAEKVGVSQDITSLIPNGRAHGEYLCRALIRMAPSLRRRARGTTIQGIARNDVASLPLLLPPLQEQRRIAAVLDAIDDAIERADEAITATERLRDALLHDLLSHGVPGWHSEWRDAPGLGTIPADWEVVRLGDVAEVKSGVGFPLSRQGRRDGVYPFIKVSDMTLEGNETYIRSANNYVDLEDVDELGADVFAPGAIVFPKVGAAIATNKKRVLTVPTIIDNNMAGVTVADARRCNSRFLHLWFESIDIFQFANVSAVPSITGSRLKRVFIPLPTLSEQQITVALLDGTDKAIEQTREERDGLRKLKASVADALLSGRMRME